MTEFIMAAAAASQQAAKTAPALNPERTHLAIIEQYEKAMSGVNYAIAALGVAGTFLAICVPVGIAIAVFLFKAAVREAATRAADETAVVATTAATKAAEEAIARVEKEAASQAKMAADIEITALRQEAARSIREVVDEATKSSSEAIEKLNASHQENLLKMQAQLAEEGAHWFADFAASQAVYRASLDQEQAEITEAMKARLDALVSEQTQRLEDLVKGVLDHNEKRADEFFEKARAQDEERKKASRVRLDFQPPSRAAAASVDHGIVPTWAAERSPFGALDKSIFDTNGVTIGLSRPIEMGKFQSRVFGDSHSDLFEKMSGLHSAVAPVSYLANNQLAGLKTFDSLNRISNVVRPYEKLSRITNSVTSTSWLGKPSSGPQ